MRLCVCVCARSNFIAKEKKTADGGEHSAIGKLDSHRQCKMQSGDKDNGGGEDGWLSSIEEQYLQTIGAEPDYERLYNHERDTSQRSVWGSFQESATSIAQLYRGKWNSSFLYAHAIWNHLEIPVKTNEGQG